MIGGWKSGLYAFLLALAVFTVFFSVVTMARAQEEIGLEGVSQKELEGLPVREGGVLAQTWDWFISLFGYEVLDAEVVKRSIVEQDLDIEDVRLITNNVTHVVDKQNVDYKITNNEQCEWTEHNQSWTICPVRTKVVTEWQEEEVIHSYQVIVTPTETYDVPDKTVCYDAGSVYVCESTLRCDGKPGIEYGCEHVNVNKQPEADGTIKTFTARNPPMRDFVTRKQVITDYELVQDASLTKNIPIAIIDEVKSSMTVEVAE